MRSGLNKKMVSVDDLLIEVEDRHGKGSLYYLHEWITPNNASVVSKKRELLDEIYDSYGKTNLMNIITKFYYYVAVDIKYVDDDYFGFIYGKNGDVIRYDDYWQFPAEVIASGVADCDGKSFLLTSLLRAVGFSERSVFSNIGFVSVGGEVSGHVYTTIYVNDGEEYLLDPSITDWGGVVLREVPEIYKTKIAFNDKVVIIVDENTDILQSKRQVKFDALVGPDWHDLSPNFRKKLIRLMRKRYGTSK